MKIYKGQTRQIAIDIADALLKEEAVDVEADDKEEFYLDIESVFRSYVETGRQIYEEAQELVQKRRLDFSSFHKVQREVAKKYNFALGDDAIDWITDQLIEMLFHTAHVAEVWADNNDIRRISRPIIYKHTSVDSDMDAEVRKKIKNLSEGSLAWDVKYQQVLEDVRRKRGL
ncbi:MAG: DUF507 family protein [Bradymonadales bacterium]|jgi:hypothetical protein